MKRAVVSAFIAVALTEAAMAQADLIGQAIPASPENASILSLESSPELYDMGGLGASVAAKYAGTKRADAPFVSRGRHDSEIYRQLSPSVVIVVTDKSIGSGSYIGLGDIILTNWHVVKGFQKVGLLFKPPTDGTKPSEADFEIAQVVKTDPAQDLALLRLASTPRNIKPIVLGSESDIQVGADVHAIGHPTGEAWTYTKGFISQYRKDYEWRDEEGTHKASVIQTQTPINPGNSGGPLLSDDGKLIGVNTFKAKGEALNFAISIADVQAFLGKAAQPIPSKAPATCKSVKLYEGRDRQNIALLVQFDTNCDGKPDYSVVTPDDLTKPISVHLDTNFDGKTDISVEDRNRDQRWDISFHDVDFDGKIDLVGYHPDGKLTPSRLDKYASGHRY
ncbi:trypsin-like peptidase domain-containing protein [Bradyrhizobium liaoningense]|uniref:S1C family serine protease n=1 Tax=Bradyrhizobium liaoningense TaxID=43992 RepID=UPI001BA6F327|nr:serine protease [Bradyrhizobium liaoningense]MBR0739639.1 trypsin-like peptidase domain-containing protein [Bradyrhizobium liaoningense]